MKCWRSIIASRTECSVPSNMVYIQTKYRSSDRKFMVYTLIKWFWVTIILTMYGRMLTNCSLYVIGPRNYNQFSNFSLSTQIQTLPKWLLAQQKKILPGIVNIETQRYNATNAWLQLNYYSEKAETLLLWIMSPLFLVCVCMFFLYNFFQAKV